MKVANKGPCLISTPKNIWKKEKQLLQPLSCSWSQKILKMKNWRRKNFVMYFIIFLNHEFVTEFPFSYLLKRQSYKTFLCWAKMSHSKSSINFLCAAESLHWIGRSKFSASYKWKQYIRWRHISKWDIIATAKDKDDYILVASFRIFSHQKRGLDSAKISTKSETTILSKFNGWPHVLRPLHFRHRIKALLRPSTNANLCYLKIDLTKCSWEKIVKIAK